MVCFFHVEPNEEVGRPKFRAWLDGQPEQDRVVGEGETPEDAIAMACELSQSSRRHCLPVSLIRQRIENRLSAFLSERRESTGGWAEIAEDDIQDLAEILHLIVEAKCEPDPDMDFPIEFELINRQRCERLHYRPVPYYFTNPHERTGKSPEEADAAELALLDEAEDVLFYNLGITMEAVQTYRRYRETALSQQKKRKTLAAK